MDVLNNSIVADVDTEVLDSQITQISNDFSETYYFDGEQEEGLEMLVAKAMKLGELYERKKWQAAKAQAVPEVLKKFCNEHKDPAWRGRLTEYDKGYSDCCIAVLEMIESQQPSSTPDCPDEP